MISHSCRFVLLCLFALSLVTVGAQQPAPDQATHVVCVQPILLRGDDDAISAMDGNSDGAEVS